MDMGEPLDVNNELMTVGISNCKLSGCLDKGKRVLLIPRLSCRTSFVWAGWRIYWELHLQPDDIHLPDRLSIEVDRNIGFFQFPRSSYFNG